MGNDRLFINHRPQIISVIFLLFIMSSVTAGKVNKKVKTIAASEKWSLIAIIDLLYNLTNAETNSERINNLSRAISRLGNSYGFQGYSSTVHIISNGIQAIGVVNQGFDLIYVWLSRFLRLFSLDITPSNKTNNNKRIRSSSIPQY